MAASFDLALARVRHRDVPDLPAAACIDQLARDAEHHTFRNTQLTPGNTLRLFVQQIARGNIACSAVHHLADEAFSDSAWCQARERLPIDVIRRVGQQVIDQARDELDVTDDIGDGSYRWRGGHRVFVVDGTSDSMPDAPQLRAHYGVPPACREGLGFPTSHLLLLMDHRSGLLVDCIDSPINTHDASVAWETHRNLSPPDVLLGDDAFAGWTHLALVLQANLHAIVPVHHKRIVDFTPDRPHVSPRQNTNKSSAGQPRSRVVRTLLGKDDQIVEYPRPPTKPDWMIDEQWEKLPASITVREIRRTVRRNGFRPITVTIVTTLLDADAYPADDLIELRLSRWMIETNIRHLKVTLKMDELRCRTLAGVRKERLVFLLVYNLIRILMLRAARRQRVNVNRVSFADALAWLRHGDVIAGDLPELKVNPPRPSRLEPRARKRGKKQFPYMTRPRAELKSELRAKYMDTA